MELLLLIQRYYGRKSETGRIGLHLRKMYCTAKMEAAAQIDEIVGEGVMGRITTPSESDISETSEGKMP